jgi:hypothetical protein
MVEGDVEVEVIEGVEVAMTSSSITSRLETKDGSTQADELITNKTKAGSKGEIVEDTKMVEVEGVTMGIGTVSRNSTNGVGVVAMVAEALEFKEAGPTTNPGIVTIRLDKFNALRLDSSHSTYVRTY